MQIAVFIYLLIEAVNIFFTSKFGFSHAMDQPPAYRDVRKVLMVARYILVALIFFLSFNSNIIAGTIFLIAPLIVDKIILQFCKRRERKRLIKLYMRKEDNPKPMSKKDAQATAKTMVEMYAKNKEYVF